MRDISTMSEEDGGGHAQESSIDECSDVIGNGRSQELCRFKLEVDAQSPPAIHRIPRHAEHNPIKR